MSDYVIIMERSTLEKIQRKALNHTTANLFLDFEWFLLRYFSKESFSNISLWLLLLS